jgi:hypothetical protein
MSAVPRAAQALRCTSGSMLSSWQLRHVTTPRKVQMMQMNVPQLAHGYPSEARSSFRQDRQIIASRSRRLWGITRICALFRECCLTARIAECISGAAFHNAFRSLEPCRHPVGSGFLPTGRHRREAPLLALALEAQPTLAVFAGDSRGAPEWPSPALRSSPPIETTLVRGAAARGGPPIGLPSLSGRGRNQPHLPPLALRIEKRPIAHRRSSVADYAPRSVLTTSALQSGCQNLPFSRRVSSVFFTGKRTYQRVSSFLPASRWSKLSSALKTRK